MNSLIFSLINLVFQALYIVLLARIILSWIDHNPYNEIIQWIYRISDPLLKPFQQLVPPLGIGVDVSPILAFFALGILKKLIFWVMF